MRLAGVELRNFRSIGSEPVLLLPLRKCSILIGQNNAGKSNVLKAMKKLADAYQPDGTGVQLSDLDLHRRSPQNSFTFKLWFEADKSQKADEDLVRWARTTSFWFEMSWEPNERPKVGDHWFAHVGDFDQASLLLRNLVKQEWPQRVGPDAIRREFLSQGPAIFQRFSSCIPPVHIIPEFRQIRPGQEYAFDGTSLVELLAGYHMPEIGKDQDQEKFDRIQGFLQRLLHLPKATLEIPHTDPKIVINDSGLRLPLASYGTGVHELLILVVAALHIENAICCIEEPEIHLHPRLQQELVEFLIRETTNQYLISTHSAALINAASSNADVQVFHILCHGGATIGRPVLGGADAIRVLRDLGIKASDILQANCIIWVEGPSDRVYLQRWIELLALDLAEGRDYEFLCYGQLPRLSFETNNTSEELVNVLKVNQNAIIVADSDRSEATQTLNKTKRAMKEECEKHGGICWVTDGREIENYLPARVVVDACNALRSCKIEFELGPYDQFEAVLNRALKEVGAEPIDYSRQKPNYARKFAEHFALGDFNDALRGHVDKIVTKIKAWGA